jgi:hypothetical protein
MIINFLNFCCQIAALPRKFKAAVCTLIIAMAVGALALASLDTIQAVVQFEGFWKIKTAAWIIYFAVLGIMYWRIYVKWHGGTFHIDEHDSY